MNVVHLISILIVINCYLCAPVDPPVAEDSVKVTKKVEEEIDNLGLEYGRYLQEVVATLEEDKEFSKKIENVSAEHIKSGDIAQMLNFVDHNIRTKLDEVKRVEMDRLRKLVKKEHNLQEFGVGSYSDNRRWKTVGHRSLDGHLSKYEHVDPYSKTFEENDLKKLIVTAIKDLEILDKKRREEFKTYEMEKEHQFRESLANMTEEEKKEAIKKHEEMRQKHKDHPKVHHPGSKQQLEEVWEEKDRMPKEEFNPKTFFSMHDINGDGYLDIEEVEALLSLEIKKIYDPNNPEDDPNEMMEEYHRMREHIYKEADKNKDGLISRQEFIDLTQRSEFEKDDGWKGLDEEQVYSEDELKQYEKHRQELLNHQYGYYVPQYQPNMPPPHGRGPPPPPGYQQFQQQPHIVQQGGYNPNPQYNAYQHAQAPQGYPPQQPAGQQQYHQQPQMGHPQQPAGQQQYHQQPQMGHPQQPAGQQQYHQQPQMGHPQQPQANFGQPQMGHPQQGQPQMGHPQQGLPQQGYPQQGLPQQGYPQQGLPQQGYPQQGLPQQNLNSQPVQTQPKPQSQTLTQQQQQQQQQAFKSQTLKPNINGNQMNQANSQASVNNPSQQQAPHS